MKALLLAMALLGSVSSYAKCVNIWEIPTNLDDGTGVTYKFDQMCATVTGNKIKLPVLRESYDYYINPTLVLVGKDKLDEASMICIAYDLPRVTSKKNIKTERLSEQRVDRAVTYNGEHLVGMFKTKKVFTEITCK